MDLWGIFRPFETVDHKILNRLRTIPFFLSSHRLVLFLLLLPSLKLIGQSSIISAQVENGKATITRSSKLISLNGKINGKFISMADSFFTSTSSGAQRTFVVNGVITLNITTIQPSCGYSNGAVIITASGGVPPYTYSIQNSGVLY